MRILVVVAALLLAGGCSQKREVYSEEVTDVALIRPRGDIASAPAADAAATAPAAAPDAAAAPRIPQGAPMLAYTYAYGLALPAQRVPEVMTAHEAACVRAGFRTCQVVSSSLNRRSSDLVQGTLVLRAAPAWVKALRDGLSKDAKDAGGRLVTSTIESEDLSREIVDVEAQLKAKLTLRDRLQALLARRPGKLSELLDLEREFARVQGEIDSVQSQLAVMRGRVATSEVTITYQTPSLLGTTGGWSVFARSLGDFGDIIAESLAALIRFVAWIGPSLLVGALVLWTFRKRLPRLRWPRRRRDAGTAAPE